MIKQHHLPAALALLLSAQLALVVCSSGDAALSTSSRASTGSTYLYSGGVSLSAASYSVSQAGGSVTLTAERNGGTHTAISVSYKTVDGTALAGSQYTAKSGTLNWADGDGGNKTFTIPVSDAKAFAGTKWFAVRLTAGPSTLLGTHTSATVDVLGATGATVTKSIRQWVSCNESIDESSQLEQALNSAANNSFTLLVDCPVRFHTGTAAQHSIAVPDGVTISFEGAGEFLIVSNGPPALTVAHPAQVSFFNWNVTYL